MKSSFGIVNGRVSFKTGAEGPDHDPYHYEEVTFERKDGLKVCAHLGALVDWIEVDGDRVKLELVGFAPEHEGDAVIQKFEELTKYNPFDLRRWFEKLEARYAVRCPKGGRHDIKVCGGHVGETVTYCTKCDYSRDNFTMSMIE